MTTFIDLLRAVNVSGQNKVPMAELRVVMAEAGFGRVETYVQSGNVVCEGEGSDAEAHATAVQRVIADRFGHDVTVIALTGPRLDDAVAENPFLATDPGADQKTLHVTVLAEPVGEAAFEALSPPATGDEAAALSADGRLVYLRLPYGYGRSKLNNAWFERALKVRATTRNWRTVLALAELARARG